MTVSDVMMAWLLASRACVVARGLPVGVVFGLSNASVEPFLLCRGSLRAGTQEVSPAVVRGNPTCGGR